MDGSASNVSEQVLYESLRHATKNRGMIDYWDSYWIIQGLIQSELYDIVNSTLQNFMDEIDTFGFIPNGGRIYCKPFWYYLFEAADKVCRP